MMDLIRISEITNGEHFGANPTVMGLVNDSRKECEQNLYVAIKGPNFDGHHYINSAIENGANGALVETGFETGIESEIEPRTKTDVPMVKVSNSVQAMGEIAAAWRNDFDLPVLGITGSAGKTTLKEMAGSVLSQSRKGIVTQGNLNNEIGVPLTLTRLKAEHEFAVIEMGMNQSGEIKYLSNMAKPTIAIINNAAPAHLDDLGTVEAVAKAKGEIIDGLSDDGVLIINADDDYCSLWKSLAGQKRTVTFGLNEKNGKADITAKYDVNANGSSLFVEGLYGQFEVELNIAGEHNVRNALAVIAATLEMQCSKVDVQRGLSEYQPLANRESIHYLDKLMLIDDTYNANPVSMQAAFNTLELHADELRKKGLSVKVIIVLGDMAELGEQAVDLHIQTGLAAKNNAHFLYCFGQFQEQYRKGFGSNANGFDSFDVMMESILKEIKHSSEHEINLVLVKGSRSAGMENVVKAIINAQEKYALNKSEVL